MYLHTRVIGLMYKRNITLGDVRYGCISARCGYLQPDHSLADIQPYLTYLYTTSQKFFNSKIFFF